MPIETAIIVAAGRGSRLKNMVKPKGFLNIGDRYLIEHSINALNNYGIRNVIIGTGYAEEYYKQLAEHVSVKLRHNENWATTGSLRTLQIAAENLNEDILVLDSDILYDATGIEYLLKDPRPNLVLVGSSEGQSDGAYVQAYPSGRVVKISKDRLEVPDPCGILVGISKLSKEALQDVKNYAATTKQAAEHHDWSFFKVKSVFHALTVQDLIFTEIDDDSQLAFAITNVYPKARLCFRTTSRL